MWGKGTEGETHGARGAMRAARRARVVEWSMLLIELVEQSARERGGRERRAEMTTASGARSAVHNTLRCK